MEIVLSTFSVREATRSENVDFLNLLFFLGKSIHFEVQDGPRQNGRETRGTLEATPLRRSKKLIYYQLKNKEKRLKNHNERKLKNIYYYNKLSKLKLKDIKIFKISDFNYQNFIDFPILVKKREKLNYFLLNNGIEARLFYYRNCEKIFRTKGKTNCKNSEKYEKQILCLPNHEKITFEYIDYIIEMIKNFHHSKN